MKIVSYAILVLLAIGAGALAWSFAPATLPVTAPPTALELIQPQPPANMRVGVFMAGRMESQGAFAYRGGPFETIEFGMDVVVVEHPKGILMFDSGFGRNVIKHTETIPWLMRQMSKITPEIPVVDQLSSASLAPERIAGVILTHAHWDHVSGLDDLRGVPVWINQAERDFIREGGDKSTLARSLGELNYRIYDFEGGAYWGFPASHDVFGDGSVVLVPAGGHTPGSIIAFVHSADGVSYALIGDLAWQHEGVDLPAERPWLSRVLVDEDAEGVRDALIKLHLLKMAKPDLVIVPAHDRRVMSTLPPATRSVPLTIPG